MFQVKDLLGYRERTYYSCYDTVQHCRECSWVFGFDSTEEGCKVCPDCGAKVIKEVGRVLVVQFRQHWLSPWQSLTGIFVPRTLATTDPMSDCPSTAGAITTIVVPTEEDKRQLLLASKYIHDLWELDTSIDAANCLAHLYLAPHLIEVQGGTDAPVANTLESLAKQQTPEAVSAQRQANLAAQAEHGRSAPTSGYSSSLVS